MSQCVPRWDLDDISDPNPNLQTKVTSRAPSNSISSTLDVPTLEYEVAELTWENGQLAMHGLGTRRVPNKPQSTTSTLTKYTWDKPRAAETLEAIVNQAALIPHRKTHVAGYDDELVPWIGHHNAAVGGGAMDALVPSSNNRTKEQSNTMGCSTYVGSCSGGPAAFDDRRVARRVGPTGSPTAATYEGSSCRDVSVSVSGSATFGMESSRQWTLDTPDGDFCARGLTSASMGSPENTSSGKNCTKSTSPDEHDSVSHGRHQNINICSKREGRDVEEKKKGKGKSSSTNKRSRAAAIHNQSERKRRDKINQRMKTLQKLVPNSNKTDKASMLDEVIEYLKQLQAQVQMMSRMNMPSMMMPLAMQQQMQMSMMNSMMGMGMGMGMGMHGVMDLNTIGRPGFHPSTFMPPIAPTWDGHAPDRIITSDAMSPFLACQPQSMTMDAYSRMAALYQQMQTQPCGPIPKN